MSLLTAPCLEIVEHLNSSHYVSFDIAFSMVLSLMQKIIMVSFQQLDLK